MTVSRRAFLKAAALYGLSYGPAAARAADTREVLYNGITLAAPWPPRNRSFIDTPIAPPYLADLPQVVPIDLGRQLFVDDFLIEDRSLNRTLHAA